MQDGWTFTVGDERFEFLATAVAGGSTPSGPLILRAYRPAGGWGAFEALVGKAGELAGPSVPTTRAALMSLRQRPGMEASREANFQRGA